MTGMGSANRIDRDLVFDIGLHNGDDAAYYLDLGYHVVGVEANPLLTVQCTLRFENEIRQGRVRIINAGVLKEPGEFTFYRNTLGMMMPGKHSGVTASHSLTSTYIAISLRHTIYVRAYIS
jgi:hypothetical protein